MGSRWSCRARPRQDRRRPATGVPSLLGVGGTGEHFATVRRDRDRRARRKPSSACATATRPCSPATATAPSIRPRRAVERGAQLVGWGAGSISKGGYDHYMYKEIREQPSSLRGRVAGPVAGEGRHIRSWAAIATAARDLRSVNRIVITACGTSWHAGLIGGYMLEELARIPVTVEYASEFRYRNTVLDEGTLVMGDQPVGGDGRHARRAPGGKAQGLPHHGGRERRRGRASRPRPTSGSICTRGPRSGWPPRSRFRARSLRSPCSRCTLARRRGMSVVEGARDRPGAR